MEWTQTTRAGSKRCHAQHSYAIEMLLAFFPVLAGIGIILAAFHTWAIVLSADGCWVEAGGLRSKDQKSCCWLWLFWHTKASCGFPFKHVRARIGIWWGCCPKLLTLASTALINWSKADPESTRLIISWCLYVKWFCIQRQAFHLFKLPQWILFTKETSNHIVSFIIPGFVALKVDLGMLSYVTILLHSTKVTTDKEVLCIISHKNIVLQGYITTPVWSHF